MDRSYLLNDRDQNGDHTIVRGSQSKEIILGMIKPRFELLCKNAKNMAVNWGRRSAIVSIWTGASICRSPTQRPTQTQIYYCAAFGTCTHICLHETDRRSILRARIRT